MIGTVLAALGLIAYTLHIPSKGASPGFHPYGSSYWVSVGAAVVMLLGAAVALAARAKPPARSGRPPGTRHEPVR